MSYQETINVKKHHQFGVELEFSKVEFNTIKEKITDQTFKAIYLLNHQLQEPDFKEWIFDEDKTVTHYKNGKKFGGEISSKILKNTKNDWQELQNVCTFLKENGATTDETCGTHLNINIDNVIGNELFFETLTKILAVYEKEIIAFLNADNQGIRPSAATYAVPLQERIIYKFKNNELKSYYPQNLKFPFETGIFTSLDGVNIKLYPNAILEVRYPNGTLDEKIIQTNLNFIINLIDAIVDNKINLQELTNIIKNKDPLTFITLYNFNELLELISPDQKTKNTYQKRLLKIK